MNLVLYTTHCPNCRVLESKLKSKNLSYTEVTDVEVMKNKGFFSVPYLEVDDQLLSFVEAVKWVNSYEEGK